MEKRLRFIRLASFVLIVGISGVKTEYGSEIEGRRAKCEEEGQPVKVDHIDKSNCFSCTCKNGFVECRSDCPLLEGCHMLLAERKDQCCQRCKGCIYNGKHHASHTEWTDSDNPCQVLRCEAGVVTVSDLQCYTPCANPLPPEPGKCCRTCPECKINGQEATDDRDVVADDPCLKCRCHNGRMTCSKKACPVLQCTSRSQKVSKGECCPVCQGTRSLITLPKTCRLQGALMSEGHKFSIDKCTNCSCQNETSICARAACPVLDCAPELQKPNPGSCCKQCVAPQHEQFITQCSSGGKYYEDGQSWQLDACGSCKCHRGMPSCAMTKCNVTQPCAPGTKLVHLPGDCCEKCVDVDGVCMVFGDPHYKTFDGKIYTFQGLGKYMLLSECKGQSFSIRVANEYLNKSLKTVILTKRVAIRFGELRLNLQQKGRVKLHRKRLSHFPHEDGMLRIERKNGNIEVSLVNGVKIFWSGKSFLEVTVPAAYKNKLCGLCGNFNGDINDEFQTRKHHLLKESEIATFANSWCVGSKATCATHGRNNKRVSRMCNSHRQEKNQKSRCQALRSSDLLGECGSMLSYVKYYKTCKLDMCKCPDGKCYCDSLMAYARECEKLGVTIPDDLKQKSQCTEDGAKKPKVSKRPQFPDLDIARYTYIKQNRLNRTRSPILIQ